MPEQLGCIISTFLMFVFSLVFLILGVYAFSRNKYMRNSYYDDYYYDTYEDAEDADSAEDSDEYY